MAPEDNMLKVVYDKRPVQGVWDDFTTVRNRVREEWAALPKKADPLSAQIKEVIKKVSPHLKV